MIRISELLLMLTGEGEKLSKSEVRVKLTVAGSVYQSSQVRIHNRSAEWNSDALPMIEIASSCESFPLKMEVILDQGYVLGSGSSEIISGRNTQDCVDIINSKDHYLYGKLLYKADWLYMAQSKFSQHRYQEPKRTIKLSEVIVDDDSGCLCGTKKVKKSGKQRTKKKVPFANELIIYEQNQLEKVGKVRKTHFPVQFYTNLKK